MNKESQLISNSARPRAAAMIGTALEQYDNALYGLMAPLLVPIFMPHVDPIYGLFLAFCMIPMTLISRPLGAFFIGRIGDTQGRRQALMLSITGMALITGLIALLPTYAVAGVAAPIAFGLLRIMQDFFLAGEYNGGAIFTLEHSKSKQACLTSSLYCASTVIGVLLASFAATGVAHLMPIWPHAWRIPYLLAVLTGFMGIYIRKRTKESPEFIQSRQKAKPSRSLKSKLAVYKWVSLYSICVALFYSTITKVTLIFTPAFIPLITSISQEKTLLIHSLSVLIFLISLPLFGLIADKIGCKTSMLTASLLTAILAVPCLYLIQLGEVWSAMLAKGILSILCAWFIAPYHVWTKQLFATQDRYTWISMSYSIGSRIGGFAPALMLQLWNNNNSIWVPALVLAASALLGGNCIYLSGKKLRREVIKQNIST